MQLRGDDRSVVVYNEFHYSIFYGHEIDSWEKVGISIKIWIRSTFCLDYILEGDLEV